MDHRNSLFVIILAAGESSRFGSPKQLAKWRDGNLLQHTIKLAESLFAENIIVVLGANAESIKQTIHEDTVTIAMNDNWQDGMASSIRCGIHALPDTAEATMILLCDQPLLDNDSLQKLILRWQQKPNSIVASEYQNTVGVPAIFPSSHFPELIALQGDKGARQILLSHKDRLISLAVPEAGTDIDTEHDIEQLTLQNTL